jgi:HEPN domain-containing protein
MYGRLDHVRGWLRKGNSDLSAARLILSADGPYDTACYHAQQAVEKYLKALLAFASDAPIPRTHNLEDLCSLCLEALPSWDPPGADVVALTPFAVESRYDFEFWPEKGEAEAALRLAERVRSSVLAAVPVGARP